MCITTAPGRKPDDYKVTKSIEQNKDTDKIKILYNSVLFTIQYNSNMTQTLLQEGWSCFGTAIRVEDKVIYQMRRIR